jgi:hypothetical protein
VVSTLIQPSKWEKEMESVERFMLSTELTKQR